MHPRNVGATQRGFAELVVGQGQRKEIGIVKLVGSMRETQLKPPKVFANTAGREYQNLSVCKGREPQQL